MGPYFLFSFGGSDFVCKGTKVTRCLSLRRVSKSSELAASRGASQCFRQTLGEPALRVFLIVPTVGR